MVSRGYLTKMTLIAAVSLVSLGCESPHDVDACVNREEVEKTCAALIGELVSIANGEHSADNFSRHDYDMCGTVYEVDVEASGRIENYWASLDEEALRSAKLVFRNDPIAAEWNEWARANRSLRKYIIHDSVMDTDFGRVVFASNTTRHTYHDWITRGYGHRRGPRASLMEYHKYIAEPDRIVRIMIIVDYDEFMAASGQCAHDRK